jgi:hypothetical protein
MVALTEQQAAAWGTWIAATWPLLKDNEANAKVIAEHVYGIGKGVWDEYNVRSAVYINRNLLQWHPDIQVEHPDTVRARQQAEAAKKVADAEAAKAEAARKAAAAERKQQRADEEWKNTHRDLLGKSNRNAYDDHAQAEQQRIADAKATVKAVNEIVSAGLRREIDKTINGYTKSNPVTGHVDHSGTAKLRAELRSISVKNNGIEDLPRTLSMVRAAIKRMP